MSIYFGQDPVRAEIAELVAKLQAGDVIDAGYETLRVDLKEEAGRRSSSGDIQPGASENEVAAQQLAQEAACMANTPGGGGLIVGVASDGELVGTDLDAEWLRHRIYELTDRGHTADVFEVMVRNTRLLVIISPPAIEPIRWRKKIYWRVGANCVEVDAATWHSKKMATLRYDWSGDNSGIKMEQVRAQALEVARDFLRAAGDGTAEELAEASNEQMLRRLKAVGRDGYLTNAGALVFVGRRAPCLDYVHRDYAGADSTVRVNRAGRSLLEELHEVFLAMEVRIGTRHLQSGLVRGQMRELPLLAAREAIVNGLAHREWGVDDPTWVEHIGLTLKVTSPGGFYGGVTESNIITHPSQSRNTALTQLLADLRIAEREGIGVDRMVREMVRMGYSRPVIREIDGPKIQTILIGEVIDEAWIAWLNQLDPIQESQDVSSLLLLREVLEQGWIDASQAELLIQLPIEESRAALAKLAKARVGGQQLLVQVEGSPSQADTAWRLTQGSQELLLQLDERLGSPRVLPSREQIARSFAAARGRISSTELGSLLGVSYTNVGSVLKGLAGEGLLEPSNPSGRGRGLFYRWIGE